MAFLFIALYLLVLQSPVWKKVTSLCRMTSTASCKESWTFWLFFPNAPRKTLGSHLMGHLPSTQVAWNGLQSVRFFGPFRSWQFQTHIIRFSKRLLSISHAVDPFPCVRLSDVHRNSAEQHSGCASQSRNPGIQEIVLVSISFQSTFDSSSFYFTVPILFSPSYLFNHFFLSIDHGYLFYILGYELGLLNFVAPASHWHTPTYVGF